MSSSSTETTIDVVMPRWACRCPRARSSSGARQVGDWVAYEEPICEISTDKIDTEVPSPVAGRLSEIVVEVGTTVDVGTVLARLATDAKPGEAHVRGRRADQRGCRGAGRDAGRGHARPGAGARDRSAGRRAAASALLPRRVTDRRRARGRPRARRGARAAAGACASRTCSPSSRPARQRPRSRRCTSSRRTGPSPRPRRRRPPRRPRAPTCRRRRSRCRACAARSAST